MIETDASAIARDGAGRVALDQRMQQTQKLESLGILAGGIAHDFNNIVMTILGNADLAERGLPSDSPLREHVHEITQAAQRASNLCKQLLAYSGKGHFEIRPLDLNAVITEMEQMLHLSVSKKASIRFTFPTVLPLIEADISQVQQVLMNLVINASEAITTAGGIISVSTGSLECDTVYLRDNWSGQELPAGRYVFIEVADNGAGMNAATRARIFDPFFTTKVAGRGLGLAAVMGIVRGHNGAIKVYSEPGKGTTFKLLFPAAAQPDCHRKPEADKGTRWRGTGTVLLVDDDSSVRKVGQRMLEALGFSVLLARDGREALEVFRAGHDTVACVILDLTMPVMDGEDAYRELRAIDPEVRVVLSSGYNERETLGQFTGKGLAGFIQKPYQLPVLAEKLRHALGE
jgi:two-component system cell cycle sensor histidine kinase/response regulator CckA